MTPHRKQPEERLSEALRDLGHSVEQSAPPELYGTLAGAFRSHHVRRRRTQRMRIVMAVAACLIFSLALLRALRSPSGNTHANRGPARIQLIPPQEVETASQQEAVQASARATGNTHSSTPVQAAAAIENFLALPTYDPTVAADGLRIIRLEGRGSDLRLAGAPVREEFSERHVVADFMVGHDGTPYAVRFVQ